MKYTDGVIYVDLLRVYSWITTDSLVVQCPDIALQIKQLPFFATISKIDYIALGNHVCIPLIHSWADKECSLWLRSESNGIISMPISSP